jgi:MoaA/NifB/PqqE/SkfB family radical SAM enzyme
MYTIDQIRHVHLEISSRCNAICPLCARNFYGKEFNDGYIEHSMTLTEAQKIFQPKFVQQLSELLVNGNFGDIVMNAEAIDILRYFKQHNNDIKIFVSTNGGARDSKFWQDIASVVTEVEFCIDGLEDTHHLYRQNTVFSTVIKNAQAFIAAGGRAGWKFIVFDHNRHQIDAAKILSKQLGFFYFRSLDTKRNQGPVFDNNNQLKHVIGQPILVDFDRLWNRRTKGQPQIEKFIKQPRDADINCDVLPKKSVYVTSIGEVYPCCFIGYFPRAYGHGDYYHAVTNQQIRKILGDFDNNALTNSFENCISWFDQVQNTWKQSFESQRLLVCHNTCGENH